MCDMHRRHPDGGKNSSLRRVCMLGQCPLRIAYQAHRVAWVRYLVALGLPVRGAVGMGCYSVQGLPGWHPLARCWHHALFRGLRLPLGLDGGLGSVWDPRRRALSREVGLSMALGPVPRRRG